MANNRLYIRCITCGETVFIAKHFAGALTTPDDLLEKLDRFFLKHMYCNDYAHYNLELCEEFPLEMTNCPIDREGMPVWHPVNRG